MITTRLGFAILLCTYLQVAKLQPQSCEHSTANLKATAFAWTDHGYGSPRDTASGAPFQILIRLPKGNYPPITIDMSNGARRWRTNLVLEPYNPYRADSAAFFHAAGKPPLWLYRVDNIEVCLRLRYKHTQIINMGRIGIIEAV